MLVIDIAQNQPRAASPPPPWTIEEHNDACFIVRDATGQALGYFYFEDEPGRRFAAKLLTRDEARRLAVNFANCSTQEKDPGRNAGARHYFG